MDGGGLAILGEALFLAKSPRCCNLLDLVFTNSLRWYSSLLPGHIGGSGRVHFMNLLQVLGDFLDWARCTIDHRAPKVVALESSFWLQLSVVNCLPPLASISPLHAFSCPTTTIHFPRLLHPRIIPVLPCVLLFPSSINATLLHSCHLLASTAACSTHPHPLF